MPRTPARALAASLAGLAALAATATLSSCGSDDDAPTDGPVSLQPASASPADGTARVTCPVHARSGEAVLALDLPQGFTRRTGDRAGCTWVARVEMEDGDVSYAIEVLVRVESVGEGASLADVHADQEPYEVDGDTPQGDDSILDLVLDEDVAAIGTTVGDRLSWRCYCDGQDLITRMAQADGVRVTWSSVVPLTEETDAAFARALAGAGTTEGADPPAP